MSEATSTPPEEEKVLRPPAEEARGGFGGRWGAAGMPLERSKDFKNSTRRLAARLRPERTGVVAVLTLAVSALSLTLIAVVIARSPYTHSNLSPGGYSRTQIIRVGETQPFAGISLVNPGIARTGDPVLDGRMLFLQYGCAACHGLSGQGQAVGRNLRNATVAKITQARVRVFCHFLPRYPVTPLPALVRHPQGLRLA